MNETVESIFAQMFAPNEIPQSVVELFDKANFFVSRIDAPAMRVPLMAVIAAIATTRGSNVQGPLPKAKLPDEIDTSEQAEPVKVERTLPDEIATTEPVQAPETVVTGQSATEPPTTAPGVPTGPMDAPATILKAPKTALCLAQMTKDELREHANQVLGYRLRITYSKQQMIDKIMARQNK